MGLDHSITVRRKSGEIDVQEREFSMRKENHIHGWAMSLDNSVDNGEFTMSTDDLIHLAERLKTVYEAEGTAEENKVAAEYLPYQEGFFFGGKGYGEWYWNDIKNELKEVLELLKAVEQIIKDGDTPEIKYWSWW